MIKIESPGIFQQVVSDAIAKTLNNWTFDDPQKKRVISAISKAVIRIREQAEFMHYDAELDRLVIWSKSSNLVYELGSDNRHGCLAELNGSVCWHRVAKRLIALYHVAALEALCSPGVAGEASGAGIAKSAAVARLRPQAMPYLKRSEQSREHCGGVRI